MASASVSASGKSFFCSSSKPTYFAGIKASIMAKRPKRPVEVMGADAGLHPDQAAQHSVDHSTCYQPISCVGLSRGEPADLCAMPAHPADDSPGDDGIGAPCCEQSCVFQRLGVVDRRFRPPLAHTERDLPFAPNAQRDDPVLTTTRNPVNVR